MKRTSQKHFKRIIKRLISVSLTLALTIGQFPLSAVRAAPGDVFEIWRDGSRIGGYVELDDALQMLQNEDTLKMLADLDYEDCLTMPGSEAGPLAFTLDLDGHTLNILGDADTLNMERAALVLSYTYMTVTGVGSGGGGGGGGSAGGALNIVLTPEPDEYGIYHAVSALAMSHSSVTISDIIVNYVSEEANRHGGCLIGASNSTLEVTGGVSAPQTFTGGAGGDYYIIADYWATISVAGSLDCRIDAYTNSSIDIGGSVSGSASVNYSSRLEVGGDIVCDSAEAALTVSGEAEAEVLGDVKNLNASGAGIEVTSWPSSNIRGPEITVHGDVDAGGPGIVAHSATFATINGSINGDPYIIFADQPEDARDYGDYDRNSGTGYFIYEHEFGPGEMGEVWVKDSASGSMAGIYNTLLTNATDATKAYYDPGDTMRISIYGEAGGAASALVSFDDPSRGLIGATEVVVLAEGAEAGLYKGDFLVAGGISAISGVVFSLDGIPGKTRAETQIRANRLPQISGVLVVTIINDFYATRPDLRISGTLFAESPERGNGVEVDFVGADSVYAIAGLPSGDGYEISLYNEDHELLASQGDITILAGQKASASISPSFNASLSVEFIFDSDLEKMLWPQTSVLVKDAQTGKAVGTIQVINGGPSSTLGSLVTGREYELSFRGGIKLLYDEQNAPPKYLYYPINIVTSIFLEPGANIETIRLQDHAVFYNAELRGTVTMEGESAPVQRAKVHVTQVLDDYGYKNTLHFYVTTDSSGSYSLPVFAGCETKVSVSGIPGGRANHFIEESFIPTVGQNTRNLTAGIGQILQTNIRLFTKYVGDDGFSEWIWDTRALLQPQIQLTNMETNNSAYYRGDESVYLVVKPGDRIHLSIDTKFNDLYSQLPYTEYTLIVDSGYSVYHEAYLEQAGAILNVRPVGPDGRALMTEQNTRARVNVSIKDSLSNQPVAYHDIYTSENSYQLLIERPGTFEVTFRCSTLAHNFFSDTHGNYEATRQFAVSGGSVNDFGDVVLTPIGASIALGSVAASPVASAPGGAVTITTRYENLHAPAGADSIILQVPPGTSYMPGSLTLNSSGLPDPAIDPVTGRFEVPVAAADPQSGFAAFRATVLADAGVVRTFTTSLYKSGAMSSTLGTAQINIETLTIEAPDYTGRREIVVSGLAPAGALVRVFDRGAPLGESTANGAGAWGMNVALPGEDGVRYRHELTASAEHAGEALYTDRRVVMYDPYFPHLTKLTVGDKNGYSWELNLMGGALYFPYTLNTNSMNLKVSAVFDNNPGVEDAWIVIEGSNGGIAEAQAAYNPATGAWDAVVIDALRIVGAANGDQAIIYVKYTPNYAFYNLASPPTEEQLRNQLPSEASGFVLTWIDEGTPAEDPDLGMEDPELDIADLGHGVVEYEIMQGSSFNVSYLIEGIHDSNASVRISMTEMRRFTPPQDVGEFNRRHRGFQVYNYRYKFNFLGRFASSKFYAVVYLPPQYGSGSTAGKAFYVVGEYTDKYSEQTIFYTDAWRIFHNMDQLIRSLCDEAFANRLDTYDVLYNRSVQRHIVKQGMSVALTAGTLFKDREDASLALYGLGLFMDWEANEASKKDLATIERMVRGDRHVFCPDDGGGSGGGYDPRRRSPAIKPAWIIDPSGVVYEVAMDEPLEGVTATLLFEEGSEQGAGAGTGTGTGAGTGSGEWSVFDMEWYGQVNPYVTMRDGWYAWDVPKGNWMVMYEKEGYRTAYSEEMYVPPIRLDVHQALEYMGPALPVGAYWTEAPDTIEIVFDRYVTEASVNSGNVSVYTEALADGGAPLGGYEFLMGSFRPVDPVEYKQNTVAKSFRFVLDGEPGNPGGGSFEPGKTYHVGFMPVVRSYAGVPLGFDNSGSGGSGGGGGGSGGGSGGGGAKYVLTVTAPPPVPVKGVQMNAERFFLDVGETAQAEARILPQNAANQSVIWASSDGDVAQVNSGGLITAIGNGVCYVTAATVDGSFEADVNVYVAGPAPDVGEVPVTGVTLSQTELQLYIGGSAQLTATVQPPEATNKNVEWSAGCGSTVATVSPTGLVTAIAEGTCVVTARTQEGGFYADCIVRVTAADDGTTDGDTTDSGATGGGTSSGGGNAGGIVPVGAAPGGETQAGPGVGGTITVHGADIPYLINESGVLAIKLDEAVAIKIVEGCDCGNIRFDFSNINGVNGLLLDLKPEWFISSDHIVSLTITLRGVGSVTLGVKVLVNLAKLNRELRFSLKKASMDFDILTASDEKSIGYDDPANPIIYRMTVSSAAQALPADDFAGHGLVAARKGAQGGAEGAGGSSIAGSGAGAGESGVAGSGAGAASGALVPIGRYKNGELVFVSPATGVYEVLYNGMRFTDTSGHWAAGNIIFVSARGLFSGVGGGLFSPDAPMTRAMFATVLARLDGADLDAYAVSAESRFSDVAVGEWYAEAVEWAADLGIVNGYGDGSFGPDDNISREQMAVMLQNYLDYIGVALPVIGGNDTENPGNADGSLGAAGTGRAGGSLMAFGDEASISPWALEAVKKARAAGIINGKLGNVFDPQGLASRAEVATIYANYIEACIDSYLIQ
ncbi:MAG: S-layer homology domain-containing protein [Oscillospiraceae bacterium]|nr:S-layer homology domain-containing protein [Oscillospiraceae bacterium]